VNKSKEGTGGNLQVEVLARSGIIPTTKLNSIVSSN
jgi:hypothetical protein